LSAVSGAISSCGSCHSVKKTTRSRKTPGQYVKKMQNVFGSEPEQGDSNTLNF